MVRRLHVAALLAVFAGAAGPACADTEPAAVSLTLREAIERALRGNPSLVDARLNRVLERTDAEEAGRRFEAQWRLRTAGGLAYRQEDGVRTANSVAGVGVEIELPTGGRLQAGPRWERRVQDGATDADVSALVVTLAQPLGRGAGTDLAHVPVDRARLTEESNLLRFRGVLMDVVDRGGHRLPRPGPRRSGGRDRTPVTGGGPTDPRGGQGPDRDRARCPQRPDAERGGCRRPGDPVGPQPDRAGGRAGGACRTPGP